MQIHRASVCVFVLNNVSVYKEKKTGEREKNYRVAWRRGWTQSEQSGGRPQQAVQPQCIHASVWVWVCTYNKAIPWLPENVATLEPPPHVPEARTQKDRLQPKHSLNTYYAGQGCVLQRWEPSVGLLWGLHILELTWVRWSCRQMALVEMRPDGGGKSEREGLEVFSY